jgi:hypothetical protein
MAQLFESAVETLRSAGIAVVVFTGPDPKPMAVMNILRGKVGIFNTHLWAIAHRHGATVVDLWSMPALRDRRAWSDDRLHFTTKAHQCIALRTAEVLGLPIPDNHSCSDVNSRHIPWPETPAPMNWIAHRRSDLTWTRLHFIPWLRRQLRGKPNGHNGVPKRPVLTPFASLEPLSNHHDQLSVGTGSFTTPRE